MIDSIITYMQTFPKWVQTAAFIAVVLVPFGVGMAVIYKIVKADRIKAGSLEIEMEDDNHDS